MQGEPPAAALFKRRFGHAPACLVRAPGSLTLLGDSAMAAEGLSLSVAVDRHVSLAAAPRTDGRIELVHPLAIEGFTFWLSDLIGSVSAEWASPVRQVLAQLQRRGVHFSGFNAAIHDRIPAGLGASAAVECATVLLVRKLFPFALTDSGLGPPPRRDPRTQALPELTDSERRHMAGFLRGVRTGQREVGHDAEYYTPLFGRAWHALVIDWQAHAVERWPFAGTAVVFCALGKPSATQSHERDVGTALSAARAQLGVPSLRAVEPGRLRENRGLLEADAFAAALHVAEENQWAVRSESALRDGDHRQLGQFLLLSHESAREGLHSVAAEADLLVQVARAHRACLGARALLGQGRIATVSLVNYHEVEGFLSQVRTEATRHFGEGIELLVLPVAAGAC